MPRGRWDRAASAGDRAAMHRRLVAISAARSVFEIGRAVTVSDVVERAGVGRNTFYVHFDDLAGAIAAAEVEAFAVISSAFILPDEVRTPIERLRRAVSEWLSIAASEPYLVMLVIRGDGTPRGAHARLRDTIETALRNIAGSARTAGVIGRAIGPLRLRAMSGAFVAFAERIIEENRRIDLARPTEELVDLCLRLMR
jgi:AcrR family transcriptional regulator